MEGYRYSYGFEKKPSVLIQLMLLVRDFKVKICLISIASGILSRCDLKHYQSVV